MEFTNRSRRIAPSLQKQKLCKIAYVSLIMDCLLTLIFRSNSGPIFNKRRPKFMAPESYLEPQFQNLFDLCYFSGKELVPVGWNVVDDDKTYPRLSSRNPQLFQTADDQSEYDHDMTNGRAASETSNEDANSHNHNYSSTTRMNEESSDEDELALPAPRVSLNSYLSYQILFFFVFCFLFKSFSPSLPQLIYKIGF